MSTLTLPTDVLRQIAAAPHRLFFFIGATNVLLAMAWWAYWLGAAYTGATTPTLPVAPGGSTRSSCSIRCYPPSSSVSC